MFGFKKKSKIDKELQQMLIVSEKEAKYYISKISPVMWEMFQRAREELIGLDLEEYLEESGSSLCLADCNNFLDCRSFMVYKCYECYENGGDKR